MIDKVDVYAWYLSNRRDFRSGVDENEKHEGNECLYLKSVVARPKDYGFISKTIEPGRYLGKRLRMSAYVKTMLPDGASVQLWLRVDGDWKPKPEYFDNMYKNRIRGSTEWAPYEVCVEVPKNSKKILFGILLNGTGQVWMADVALESVAD